MGEYRRDPENTLVSGISVLRTLSPTTFLRLHVAALLLLVAFPWVGAANAQSEALKKAREAFYSGKYQQCVVRCDEALADYSWSEEAWHRKIEAQMTLGLYPESKQTLEAALQKFRSSIQLRWLGANVYRFNREPEKATKLLAEFRTLANNSPARFSDSANRICVGRYLLSSGYDGRQVLELVYDRVKKERPEFADAYVASAELALEKHDYGIAAQELQRAVKLDPLNPQPQYLLARALAATDAKQATAALQKALKINPRHVPSLLLMVDRLIDSEDYAQANRLLEQVMEVNIRHPVAWSYMSVLAHLEADFETEKVWREAALAWSKSDPNVDHLIGRKLSQKYRFAEGAKHQEAALKLKPSFLPAQIQLSQDLLRLGDEERGWKLAAQVYEQDGYNVVAHNLVTLQENIAKFTSLEGDGILLRMDAKEAEIYGARVMDLLIEARKVLCEKYDVQLQEPTIVEIFPEQKDFAIRTFGLPGGAGFLGVCFGRVITANSPASQGDSPSNWEAVLWHEFCHVVTLQKTNNRMPRWLSEGISVYEEVERNATWGQSMTPQYRAIVLGDELTPVSKLSGAFLNPASPLHLQFAYYESSLVVRFLVEKYGLPTLQKILVDLSVGMPINRSLQRYAGSIELLDKEFEAYAKSLANSFLPKANWDEYDLPPTASLSQIVAWNKEHPGNLAGLRREAAAWMRARKFAEAKAALTRLLKIYPQDAGGDSAYMGLALVHRELGDTQAEYQVLKQLAAISNDSVGAYKRLMELDSKAKRWRDVIKNGERLMAVNPLIPVAHRQLARASEAVGDKTRAIRAYRGLVQVGALDPADIHFRLARLLKQTGDLRSAKRQTLMALEDAPRFRDAHRLLLEILKARRELEKKESSEPKNEKIESAKPATNKPATKKSADRKR